jgi:hypothetical protein
VVGFVSLPDEHAPSVKYRVRRVLHAQRTDPIKPPRSAPPAGVELLLLPDRIRVLYGRKWLSWWLSRKPISCCRWPFRDPLNACP